MSGKTVHIIDDGAVLWNSLHFFLNGITPIGARTFVRP
jgi:hypothetical protein